MRPEVAQRRIQAFRDRFSEAHFVLAIHASFPLALTPDLLYHLWANFQQDICGEVLNIPWLAVSDLLLSSLCDEVGHELYEMPKEVRSSLLAELKANPDFGSQRINELSDFLLAHVKQQLESHDSDIRDFAQAQRWTALAYVKPNEVAKEIASVFANLQLEHRTEWMRMTSLVEIFSESLKEFEPLLLMARRIRNSSQTSTNAESLQTATTGEGSKLAPEYLLFLQQRLAEFREAGQNLELGSLVTRKALAKFGVEYQMELVDELEQAVEDCTGQDNKLIFTGHRGCGKSTLLAELGFRLTESGQYFVVNFSIADAIEESAVDHVNILFSIAVQLLDAAERRDVKLKPGLKQDLYRWLGKHTQTESKSVESAIETTGEASLKGGIPATLEFLAKVKSSLQVNSVIRKEISIEFARKISDLIARINEIQTYIENATGQTILVIIDGLDKLDFDVTETVFGKNIRMLLAPNSRIIYTMPISILREAAIKSIVMANIKKIHTMPVAKFFSKATVRQPDRVPDAAMMTVFGEILDRRFPKRLIDPAILPQIILKSGGVLGELIRIVDLCCDRALQKIRRQIRQQQFDQPTVVIDQPILESVLTDLQISYSKSLGQNDFDLLVGIYREFKPKDTENQRFLDLLYGLYVLEYRNAVQWYDLHPLVADLLQKEGILNVQS